MKVLAEISASSGSGLRAGTLRRSDLEAFGGLLGELGDAHAVLVTGEGWGRRRTAAGLAAASAATGARTALLECDLAEPGLADALGLAIAPGLHEHLRGTATVESVLKPVVLAGPASAAALEPLVCVVAGRPSREAAALLGSDRFQRVVQGLRGAYERIVVDGPPPSREAELLAAVEAADATLVAIDGTGAPPRLPVPVAGAVVAA